VPCHYALTGFLRTQYERRIVARDPLALLVVGIPLIHDHPPTLSNIKGNVARTQAVADGNQLRLL
jgi:hypothetical protein